MKRLLVTIIAVFAGQVSMAGDHALEKIIPMMKEAKISLLGGIALSEKSGAVATSAKFEINDAGALELSVYTIPEGLKGEPENATLTELSGDARKTPFNFKQKVFTDKEHIARSAVHMTMFQLSKLSLTEVVQKAVTEKKGVAIDVRNPMVRNGVPVADVVVAQPNGKAVTVTVNLVTGKVLGTY